VALVSVGGVEVGRRWERVGKEELAPGYRRGGQLGAPGIAGGCQVNEGAGSGRCRPS
jgi:hypothetical protein